MTTRYAATKPSTRHVLRAYRSATVAEATEGRQWYERARDLAVELDPGNVPRAAAVIAVLSPVTPWARNQHLARLAYDATLRTRRNRDAWIASMPTLRRNATAAWAILTTRDETELDSLVRGPKVRQFWHAIVNPGSGEAIVIDRHAVDVALGRVTDDTTRGRILGRKGGVDEVATCYRAAARILTREHRRPVTAVEVQAVTWVYWRRNRAHHQTAHRRGAFG